MEHHLTDTNGKLKVLVIGDYDQLLEIAPRAHPLETGPLGRLYAALKQAPIVQRAMVEWSTSSALQRTSPYNMSFTKAGFAA